LKGLPSDLVLAFVLLDIVVILTVARACGLVAVKVGQPRVVGEIVAGILLGPSLLGATIFTWGSPPTFLHCDQSIEAAPAGTLPSITTCLFPQQARGVLGVIGQIALIFFMFLVGLELDFSLLKGRGRAIVILGTGAVVIPILTGLAIGPVLHTSTFLGAGTGSTPTVIAFSLFLAAMLSVTAFPVMARILQEKNMSASAMGAVGVAAAAVVTVLMFLTLAVASGVSSNQGPEKLGLKFVIAGIFIAALFFVVRPVLDRTFGAAYRARGEFSPSMFALLMIVLFAGAYIADRIGINVIVGGFLVGAILPERETLFKDVAVKIADLTIVILLPIFLAFSGLATDFTKLTAAAIPGVLLFLAAGVACKWGGAAVSARFSGLSWKEGNLIGILMNCRGLLVLVVGLIAFNQGVISAQMQVAGVLMALVTTAMTGPLFDRFVSSVAPTPSEAAPPPPKEGTKVLVAINDLDRAPLVARAGYSLVHEHPAEVLLVRLFKPPLYGWALSSIPDGETEVVQSLRALRLIADWPPEGVQAVPIAMASADPAHDLVNLVTERGADIVVTGLERPPTTHAPSARLLQRALRRTDAAVVASWIPDDTVNLNPAAPVRIVDTAPDEPLPALVERLLPPGSETQRLPATTPDLDALAADANSIILLDRQSRDLKTYLSAAEQLIPSAPCPVHLVWPVRAPIGAVAAP
jgi:K+:H+ antiporter